MSFDFNEAPILPSQEDHDTGGGGGSSDKFQNGDTIRTIAALLTLLHGRPPTSHLFPVNLFVKEMDVGDPYTFLFLKRGRMPIKYAFKDCVGFRDIIEDTLETIVGSRFNYRTFEPAEGMAHIGPSRTARIMAGLRITGGGTGKYWLPVPNSRTPLLSGQMDDDRYSLNFHDPDPNDEVEYMYSYSRKLGEHGDYNFPVIDSDRYKYQRPPPPKPQRKRTMSKRRSKLKGKGIAKNFYFEIGDDDDNAESESKEYSSSSSIPPFRDGCVDLVREDGKRLEIYTDPIETLSHGPPSSTLTQSYESILARDPFIQEPIASMDVPQPLPISAVNPVHPLEMPNAWLTSTD
ncbi:3090_t:CDS:2 [Racocetra fulgida]|uniref:3090_t:CDS:1 n=1 Tax=Racocetra fulgida TaxID=60492 RepID=A0A9N9DWB9_9GLOM|nr:3090_t:CDS:2 [Racocetra fulgida]